MSTPQTPAFSVVRLREGYAIAEVDTFLAEITPWLAGGSPRPEVAERIRTVRFSPVRLRRGYDMGEVDDHLEQLETLASQGSPQG